jgi:hypothetical protein
MGSISLPILSAVSALAAVLALSPAAVSAQSASPPPALAASLESPAGISSSAPEFSSSAPEFARGFATGPATSPVGVSKITAAAAPSSGGTRPLSAVGLGLEFGSGGVGVDLVTPLSRHFNLRASASFFSYSPNLVVDGLDIGGAIRFENASASLDIFPFHNGFRISPGLTSFNKTHLDATLLVPAGQSFTLNGASYTSDPTNPVHGTGNFAFGQNKVVPRFTLGYGNLIRRRGHFSFLAEAGFQYIAAPVVLLTAAGNSCSGPNNTLCGPVDQTNVAQEQNDIQNDLAPLRFYPIVSLGIGFKFGHAPSH